MNRWKLNISSQRVLGLAAVLVIFCLVLSTGTTWARYRTDVSKIIEFEVRKPMSVYLGQVEYSEAAAEGEEAEGKFVQTDAGSWEWNEDGCLRLKFAIANGISEKKFETRDQQVCIRVIGSLGAQSEEQPIILKLTVPKEEEPEESEVTEELETTRQIEATATPIAVGSAMHATFGEGWVFSFVEEEGEELACELKGGELSWVEVVLTMEGGTLADTSLLQLQITPRYIKY